MSPVDRFGLYTAREAGKYCSTFCYILFKVIIDRIFLLLGFCSGNKFNLPIFISSL